MESEYFVNNHKQTSWVVYTRFAVW